MCGITGFIGRTKNKSISNKLITNLFEQSESRGKDASGFWAVEQEPEGSVLYYKEPIRSKKFIKKSFWLNFLKLNVNLCIAHARGASLGVGEPFYNENNHPFISPNALTAVIHNGRIDEEEYEELQKIYEVKTQCDSEMLLRIFLNSENSKKAIKDVFSFITKGHMACAIAKKENEENFLWLFRNKHRPLWCADVRDELGQIFFFSEFNIWLKAIEKTNMSFYSKIIEVPTEEIWEFKEKNNIIELNKTKVIEEKKEEKEFISYHKIKKENKYKKILSNLDENDQIIEKNIIKAKSKKILEIDEKCNDIINKIKNIKDYAKEDNANIIDKELTNAGELLKKVMHIVLKD